MHKQTLMMIHLTVKRKNKIIMYNNPSFQHEGLLFYQLVYRMYFHCDRKRVTNLIAICMKTLQCSCFAYKQLWYMIKGVDNLKNITGIPQTKCGWKGLVIECSLCLM